ncbi:hypothetical protein GWI33_018855 [Rhynchophorus ferrugineus]|uniref:Uncharacterized protein n=1 Tax=Rhynchophorus ferrugineus TaxID=354439 RepID=A0A834HZB2_RHYFE|nr:hypothetical protein GWI33_018855 [Rhynchophorus ferrugineus]
MFKSDAAKKLLVRALIVTRVIREVLDVLAFLTFPKSSAKVFVPSMFFSYGITLSLLMFMIAHSTLLDFRHLAETQWTMMRVTEHKNNMVNRYRKILLKGIYMFHVLGIVGNFTWHFTGGQKHIIFLRYVEKHHEHLSYYAFFIELSLLQASIYMVAYFTYFIFDTVLAVIEQIYLFAESVQETKILYKSPNHYSMSSMCPKPEFHQDVHDKLRKIYYEHLKIVRMATLFYESPVPKLAGCIGQLIAFCMIPIVISCSMYFSKIKMIIILTCIILMVTTATSVAFIVGQFYSDQVCQPNSTPI